MGTIKQRGNEGAGARIGKEKLYFREKSFRMICHTAEHFSGFGIS
jgi:hypothetical protein